MKMKNRKKKTEIRAFTLILCSAVRLNIIVWHQSAVRLCKKATGKQS